LIRLFTETKTHIFQCNGLRLHFPIVHSLVCLLLFRSTCELTSRTKCLPTLLSYGFRHHPCNRPLSPKEYALTMSLILRLLHIAFVRLNIQIFHFHHNQPSPLLPKHRKICLIATTHQVNRLGLHLYYKTNSSFQLQWMMSTQQKWVPSVFYHIGTIVKK
jgi:hypothetical protein